MLIFINIIPDQLPILISNPILPVYYQVSSGSGLAFVAISEAVSQMNAPYVWAILFFTMLILLGLDSEFGTLEGAVTPLIVDMKLFPTVRKEIVSGGNHHFYTFY